MDFLNPALLAGAAAAAAPIILHLIMRQQPRRLEFPALRFIQIRQDANRRRLRLRHLLLLLCRTAAICLLAAALARPSIKSSGIVGGQEAPVAAAMVFDTMPRMDYRHENKTRLEVAREIGLWLARQLPAESQVAVLDSRRGEAVFQVDLNAARQRIQRLETTPVGRPLWETLDAAAELLDKGPPQRQDIDRKELYVFTDLARSAWDAPSAARLSQRLAELEELGVYLVDVGVDEPRNFALGEVHLSDEVLARNRPWAIHTELSSTQPGTRSVELYLLDAQGKPQKRGQETVAVSETGAQGVEFPLGGLELGTHQGYLRIVGTDGLAADDRRYFTVEVKPPWKVLVAAASPADSGAFLLTEALAPEGFRLSGQARFDCQVIATADLAQQPLEEYAAIALVDPAPLPDDMWQLLSGYVRAGGGLAIFLGPAAKAEAFNQPAAQELLPARLEQVPARYPDGDLYLTSDNDQHPMLAKFRSIQGSVPWNAFPVYRYWRLGKLSAGVATVMAYANNRPAVLEKPLGKGRVVTMTTPVEGAAISDDRRWNWIAAGFANWPFMMLADQMFSYLVGSADSQLNYQAGEIAVLRLHAGQQIDTYLLSTPRGETFRQTVDPDRQAILVTATGQVGSYRVRAGGAPQGIDRGFSVNLPVEASRMERIGEERLREVFGETEFRLARDAKQLIREIGVGRVGRELYPLLIALVAVVLGLEHVLANRFYREK